MSRYVRVGKGIAVCIVSCSFCCVSVLSWECKVYHWVPFECDILLNTAFSSQVWSLSGTGWYFLVLKMQSVNVGFNKQKHILCAFGFGLLKFSVFVKDRARWLCLVLLNRALHCLEVPAKEFRFEVCEVVLCFVLGFVFRHGKIRISSIEKTHQLPFV